jgi:hypothetical protein
MVTSLFRKVSLYSALLFSTAVSAQDSWSPSVPDGFGLPYNEFIYSMYTFKGKIYAGTGDYTGEVFSSPTGNPGSWSSVFNGINSERIGDITSTNEGGGYMYFSTYGTSPVESEVYRSFDGISHTLFYKGTDEVSHIVPFLGTGSEDSVYVFEDLGTGTVVWRAAYNSNDPSNLAATWSQQFDFSSISPFTYVTSAVVHNGKLYTGLSNGGKLYSTADGSTWIQNTFVGSGFGDPDNNKITSLCSFGGYLYAGTFNPVTGAQLYRSNDDINWTMVYSDPSSDMVTDMEATGSILWIAMRSATSGPSLIVRTDGTSFTISENTGFGDPYNNGDRGVFASLASNIYYGQRNYYPAAITPGRTIGSTGGQIWRACFDTAPEVNLGPDALVCGGVAVTFDAGLASLYQWSNGSTSQQVSVTAPGNYSVMVMDANGCVDYDTVKLSNKATPVTNLDMPEVTPAAVCLGDTIHFELSTISNVFTPMSPLSKVTHDTIDYALGDQYDSLLVSGIPGSCSCTSLYSVTIDSIEHPWVSDVFVGLFDPNGSYISLTSSAGGSGDNYTGTEFRMDAQDYTSAGAPPFTGQFLPIDPFSSLYGNPNGYWVLHTGDVFSADNGVLKGWTIRFQVEDTIMSFSWTPATGLVSTNTLNTSAAPTVNTTYTLVSTNSIGCSDTTDVAVYIPQVDIVASDDTICYGSSTTLNASGGYYYNWTADPTLSGTVGVSLTATPVVNTTYYINDTVEGCVVSDSITIYPDTEITSTVNADTICFGDTATLTMSVTGGTTPYTYMWSDGSGSYYTQSINVSPLSATAYTVYATDAYGCYNVNNTFVAVTPSTDIYGHVSSASSASITNGTVVLYKYEPIFISFDTVQITTLDASGNYYFGGVNHDDYIIKVFADSLAYPLAVPTYYGNSFLWDSAYVINHYCSEDDTLDIVMVEEQLATGPGFLRGVIIQGEGFGRVEGDPVPGIDVKLGRNPSGQLVISTETDSTGHYYFTNVPYNAVGEFYTVYVDIPGLERDSSYSFVVDAVTDSYYYLDYLVDSTKIYIIPDAGAGIDNNAEKNITRFTVYPNPSMGTAAVEYTLTVAGQTSLGIYNPLGMKITELVNDKQQAGSYRYEINSRNYNLSAGVYFITLITDGKTSIHRLVISE